MTDANAPDPTRLLLTVPEAGRRLGIGRTLMYELISTGQIASVHVGRLRRVRPSDLEAYTEHLANDPQSSTRAA